MDTFSVISSNLSWLYSQKNTDDILDYDTAELIAKRELETGGLVRLYYFLGDANCCNDIFRINGYGNLEDFTRQDVRELKQMILDELKDEE